MTRGLRSVRAILRTKTSLDREQSALLHFGGIPLHAMCRRCLVHQLVEGEVVDFGDFGFGPVGADGGGDAGHGAGVFVGEEGVAFAVVVWEAGDGGFGFDILVAVFIDYYCGWGW